MKYIYKQNNNGRILTQIDGRRLFELLRAN